MNRSEKGAEGVMREVEKNHRKYPSIVCFFGERGVSARGVNIFSPITRVEKLRSSKEHLVLCFHSV